MKRFVLSIHYLYANSVVGQLIHSLKPMSHCNCEHFPAGRIGEAFALLRVAVSDGVLSMPRR
jgi:hypothetical protein